MKSLMILFLSIVMSASECALARFESPSEAMAQYTEYSVEYFIRKDGTYDQHIRYKIRPSIEEGRESIASQRFRYVSSTTKLMSIKAETINDGISIPVEKTQIEDKAVSSDATGFDTNHNVTINYAKVGLKSEILLDYHLRTKDVPFAGQFAKSLSIGRQFPLPKGSKFAFYSEIPLKTQITDRDGHLKIDAYVKNKDFPYAYVYSLSKVAYFRIVMETPYPWFKSDPEPTITVSSFGSWQEVGKKLYANGYALREQEELPKVFEDLIAKVNPKLSFVEKANLVTSLLSEKVRYMGDWRTVKGQYVPRSLMDIAKTEYGDCKDLAFLTTKLFAKLGIKSQMAVISRDLVPSPLPDLPNPFEFNHLIVRAEDESGKIHWVDPTNSMSMAQMIRYDIAGRSALVLDPKSFRLEDTPPLTSSLSQTSNHITFTFVPGESKVAVKGDLSYRGMAAEDITGLENRESRAELKEKFLRQIADGYEVITGDMKPFDLKSKIVKDVNLGFEVLYKKDIPETSAGYLYEETSKSSNLIKVTTNNRIGGIFLGLLNSELEQTVIDKASVVGKDEMDCSYESKWVSGKVSYREENDQIFVTRSREIKAYGITREELDTDEFKALQKSVASCDKGVRLIFKSNASNALSH